MLDTILKTTIDSWVLALEDKSHPFRLFTLCTVDALNQPKCRTVVLRHFDTDGMEFSIFTDGRSQKVEQLSANPNVQLLFYDAKALTQVVVTATVLTIHNDQTLYDALPENNKKDYTSTVIPGIQIKSPELIDHDFNTNFFNAITFKALKLDVLRLKRPNHIRCSFDENEGQWKGNFVAP